MNGEEFYEAPVPEALISNAVARFNSKHQQLLVALHDCGQNPSPNRGQLFNECSIATRSSFKEAVAIVAECEDLTAHDRAGHIAALCINSEQVRLEFLKEASPAGEFEEVPNSHEDLQGMFEEFIESDLETAAIAESAASIYSKNFSADLAEFFDSVQLSRKAKMKYFLVEEVADFGKLTAASALGALIAGHLMKKSKR